MKTTLPIIKNLTNLSENNEKFCFEIHINLEYSKLSKDPKFKIRIENHNCIWNQEKKFDYIETTINPDIGPTLNLCEHFYQIIPSKDYKKFYKITETKFKYVNLEDEKDIVDYPYEMKANLEIKTNMKEEYFSDQLKTLDSIEKIYSNLEKIINQINIKGEHTPNESYLYKLKTDKNGESKLSIKINGKRSFSIIDAHEDDTLNEELKQRNDPINRQIKNCLEKIKNKDEKKIATRLYFHLSEVFRYLDEEKEKIYHGYLSKDKSSHQDFSKESRFQEIFSISNNPDAFEKNSKEEFIKCQRTFIEKSKEGKEWNIFFGNSKEDDIQIVKPNDIRSLRKIKFEMDIFFELEKIYNINPKDKNENILKLIKQNKLIQKYRKEILQE